MEKEARKGEEERREIEKKNWEIWNNKKVEIGKSKDDDEQVI